MLNEDDLIMVVKDDVVKQIDANRGEMNRTEFVNYLIQYQLKECFSQKEYVSREEFQQFTQQITELLHSFLQFFVSYGMALGKDSDSEDIQALGRLLESFHKADEESEES